MERITERKMNKFGVDDEEMEEFASEFSSDKALVPGRRW